MITRKSRCFGLVGVLPKMASTPPYKGRTHIPYLTAVPPYVSQLDPFANWFTPVLKGLDHLKRFVPLLVLCENFK